MRKMSSKNERIFRLLEQMSPEQCPNFYLSGHSISSMEKLGIRIADKIEKEKLRSFKGIVKRFTILMPLYEDENGAKQFMKHLKNSISIARDCYDEFQGIVLVEMAQEWSGKGYHKSLSCFFQYIRKHPEICFILLCPFSGEYSRAEEIYREISGYSTWWKIDSLAVMPHQGVTRFCEMAEEKGYEITESLKDFLLQTLEQRKEDCIDHADVMEQLFKQVMFERSLQEFDDKIIDLKDVKYISGMTVQHPVRKIGFSASI